MAGEMTTFKALVERIRRRGKPEASMLKPPSNTDMESLYAPLGGCPEDEYVVRHLYDVAGFYDKTPPKD